MTLPAEKGFTLIELMVAISIIAIISAIGFVSYSQAQVVARDGKRKQDLRALQTALELYYQDPANNHTYPQFTDINSSNSTNWGNLNSAIYPKYLNNPIPDDPLATNYGTAGSTTWYVYSYSAAGTGYILCANLENKSDKDIQRGPYSSPPFPQTACLSSNPNWSNSANTGTFPIISPN